MTILTSKQRAHLRRLGQKLRPQVFIGKHGITESLITNLDQALDEHELVKVKWQDTVDLTQEEISLRLCEATGACSAGTVGRTIVVFRRSEKNPRIKLPDPEPEDTGSDPDQNS